MSLLTLATFLCPIFFGVNTRDTTSHHPPTNHPTRPWLPSPKPQGRLQGVGIHSLTALQAKLSNQLRSPMVTTTAAEQLTSSFYRKNGGGILERGEATKKKRNKILDKWNFIFHQAIDCFSNKGSHILSKKLSFGGPFGRVREIVLICPFGLTFMSFRPWHSSPFSIMKYCSKRGRTSDPAIPENPWVNVRSPTQTSSFFHLDLTAVERWLEKSKTYCAHGDFMQKSHLPEIQEYKRGV